MKAHVIGLLAVAALVGCSGSGGAGGGSASGGGSAAGGGSMMEGDAGLGVSTATRADGGTFLNLDESVALGGYGYENRQVDPQLTAVELPAAVTAPNFAPKAGSPALTGGATPPNDGFFDATATFVGAIGTTDWTQGWTTFTETGNAAPAGTRVPVTGKITANTTWTKGNVYVLDGIVHVGSVNDGASVTLTIEPGTQIRGKSKSALVVTKNGRLVADGTQAEPIVFTADFPAGQAGVGANNWGGIVMNGRGDLNMPGKDNLAEGLADLPENRYGGGTSVDATHDCGSLKYVRIEFAGDPLSANNELNGLTLNACGSKTVIDYLQVHRGIDDGVELFGGSVNLKHVLITGSDDDGLDWDRGWTGKVQFLLVQQLPGRGNHGIEGDNWSTDNDALPRSKPVLFNVTLIGRTPETDNGTGGEGSSRGITLRVGSAGQIQNLLVTRFSIWGAFIDSPSSINAWAAGQDLFIKNSIFWNNAKDDATQGFRDVKP